MHDIVTPAIGMTKPTVAFLLCVSVLLDTDTEVVDLWTENLKRELKQMCAKGLEQRVGTLQ